MRRHLGLLVAFAACAALVHYTQPASADHVNEGDVRFKVTCEFDHSAPDDPIVYPNQPGASHLHDFFGARGIDAGTTTYQELLALPATCNDRQDHAGYWVPALYTTTGKADPSRVAVYYRRGNKHGTIKPYPNGLKMIAGWPDPDTGSGWKCGGNLTTQHLPLDCGDDHLSMVVRFPDCWDGVRRDSPDHRAHMAYSHHDDTAEANVCPASHPVPVPDLTLYVNYASVPDGSTVVGLSSGDVGTVHGDFFNGWERSRLLERIETCLNQLQRCDNGG